MYFVDAYQYMKCMKYEGCLCHDYQQVRTYDHQPIISQFSGVIFIVLCNGVNSADQWGGIWTRNGNTIVSKVNLRPEPAGTSIQNLQPANLRLSTSGKS